MTGDSSNLVAVVTGGASGIGAATTMALTHDGARVAVLDLSPAPSPPGGMVVPTDVADDESVRAAIDAAATELGGVDILVNCAGIGARGTVEDNPDAEWRKNWEVNLLGIVRTSRAALPHLRASHSASVVNIGSIVGLAGLPQRAVYSATKGAVHALTKAMAADHLHEGVRVNCVAPGTVDTPWVQQILSQAEDPAAELAALRARQPHGRLVTADEVAEAVTYLASPRSGSTTGIVLPVDGGMLELRLRPQP